MPDTELNTRLDAVLARAAAASGTPGAQAALVRNGALTWTGSFGLADRERARPVTDETTFCLASIGKTLLCALMLKQVESGKVSLDQPLCEVIAELPGGEIPGGDKVTLRMLLSHTAGYPDLYESPAVRAIMPPEDPSAGEASNYDPDLPFTWEMLVAGIGEPVGPGSRWAYSNTGYIVLCEVLTRILGGTSRVKLAWDSFVAPLGLTSDLLTLDRSTVDVSTLAHGYEGGPDGSLLYPYAAYQPAGVPADLFGFPFGDGLFGGSATGVAQFLDALFVRCVLLDPTSLGQMTATTTQARTSQEDNADLKTYGMGTFRIAAGSAEWQGHSGSYGGFSNLAGSQRETALTLVVLSNGMTAGVPVRQIWHELSEECLSAAGLEPKVPRT